MNLTLARNSSPKLSKRRSTRPSQNTTNQPNNQRQTRRRNIRIDRAGRSKDTTSDNDADDYTEGFDGAEVTRKGTPRRGCIVICLAMLRQKRLLTRVFSAL